MIQNSSANHDNLRQDLQNDFTKGSDQYPENRAQALMFLDRYSKSVTPVAASEGTAFTQKSKGKKVSKSANKKDAKNQDYDKDAFKDKNCYHCGKKGHPKSHCPNLDNDDDSVKSSKSSSSLSELQTQLKSMKKSFAQLESKLQEVDSEGSIDAESLFQYNF